jgi:hypothetical protein
MTARPLDHESRRRLVSAAVALVLVAALVMAAGCVSQSSGNQTQTLPKEKYVFLVHMIDTNLVSVSGSCVHPTVAYSFSSAFDENTGVLKGTVYTYDPGKDYNDPLILVYFEGGRRYFDWKEDFRGKRVVEGNPVGVFSFPAQFNRYSENISLDSVSGDGAVAIRYKNESIILKPKERWENISHKMYYGENFHLNWDTSPQPAECSEDIVTVDTLYNAGVFDKKIIAANKTGP